MKVAAVRHQNLLTSSPQHVWLTAATPSAPVCPAAVRPATHLHLLHQNTLTLQHKSPEPPREHVSPSLLVDRRTNREENLTRKKRFCFVFFFLVFFGLDE